VRCCSPSAGTSEGVTPGKALVDFIFQKIPMKPNKNEKIEARHFAK
jgi:hypothetical protein